jgi:hypothetical protein
MQRVRLSLLPWLALLVFPAVWAAPPSAGTFGVGVVRGAAPVAASAAYAVRFSLFLARTLPPGAAILCKARLTSKDHGLRSLSAQPVQSGQATLVGSNANCSVHIPFTWAYDPSNPASSAEILYEIDTVSAAGQPLLAPRVQSFQVSYPTPNTTATLDLQLAF